MDDWTLMQQIEHIQSVIPSLAESEQARKARWAAASFKKPSTSAGA